MAVFFTSDTHFNHPGILRNKPRQEFLSQEERDYLAKATVEETKAYKISPDSVSRMNEAIIDRWNSKVGKLDTVYHLGDVGFGNCKPHVSRLNGNIILILGNHDHKKQVECGFKAVCDYLEVNVGYAKIVMCHYPFKTWNKRHYGTWHIHGHTHGMLPIEGGLSMDVGVDTNNFYPYDFEEVANVMKSRADFKG